MKVHKNMWWWHWGGNICEVSDGRDTNHVEPSYKMQSFHVLHLHSQTDFIIIFKHVPFSISSLLLAVIADSSNIYICKIAMLLIATQPNLLNLPPHCCHMKMYTCRQQHSTVRNATSYNFTYPPAFSVL